MSLFQVNVRKSPSSGFTAHYYNKADYAVVVANYAQRLSMGDIVEYVVVD